MATITTPAEPRATDAEPIGPLTLRVAAAAMAISALIHLFLVPEHLHEWPAAGVFFTALGVAQAALAVALVGAAGTPVLIASVWSSGATIVLYVWSRTAGLAFAPAHEASHGEGAHVGHAVGGHGNGVPQLPDLAEHGNVEPVGLLDLTALGAELLVVGLLLFLLPIRWQRRTGNAALAAAVILTLVGTSVIV